MKRSKILSNLLGMLAANACLAIGPGAVSAPSAITQPNAGVAQPNAAAAVIQSNAGNGPIAQAVASNTGTESTSTPAAVVELPTTTPVPQNTAPATAQPTPVPAVTEKTASWIDRVYVDAGGGYVQNGSRFRGGGGSFDVGFNMFEWHGVHNVELQFKFLIESGAKDNNYGTLANPVLVPNYGGGAPVLGYMYYALNVDFDQYPILLNYRYRLALGKSKFGFYAGTGIGINIVNWTTQLDTQIYNSSGGTLTSPTTSTRVTRGTLMGQVFTGLSYKITDNLFINGGATLMFTQEYSWGGSAPAGTADTPPGMHTCCMHWMVDAAFTLKF